MRSPSILFLPVLFCALFFSCGKSGKGKLSTGPRSIEVLFLGHASEHHHSARYMPMLAAALPGADGAVEAILGEKPHALALGHFPAPFSNLTTA